MRRSLWHVAPNDLVRRVSVLAPLVGLAALFFIWGSAPSPFFAVVLALVHVGLVTVTVGHAEAIAHRVGEPFGTLVLAVAVTVIEVSLIITLMLSEGPKAGTLARDTVFAAVMIVCHGVIGLSVVVGSRSRRLVRFSEQGANALLGTVVTIATLSLVLPSFTSSSEGGTFTGPQLAFAAVASIAVYGVFVFVQTVGHRWMFLSPEALDDESDDDLAHVTPTGPPAGRLDGVLVRTVLLVVGLVGVVGFAKVLAPSIEDVVVRVGAPQSFVGVVMALMILLPESVAALRAAHRGEMQTSLNLSLGSALASIGLTIPAIAVASIWLDGPIVLGLGSKEIVLLALTAIVGSLTFGSGRATVLQGVQHLAVFSAFIFLAAFP